MKGVKNPLVFVFITILIDSIGIGIIFPVSATIVMEVTGLDINQATPYSGELMTVYALMQFVCAPILGGLSDRFGRRPVLLLSLFGLGIDYIFLSLAPSFAWLVAGRIIAGIGGASFSTAFAYVADISPPEKRAQNFGLMGAAFGLGFTIGPFIGGLFSNIDSRAPFVAAAVLTLLNFLYGYFIIPESLKPENRRKFDWKRANPFGAFVHLKRNRSIRILVLCMFLLYLAGNVMPAIWNFYTKILFNWNDFEIGNSLAFVGVMIAVVQGGLIKFSQKKFGPMRSVYIGMSLYVSGLFLFAFASEPWMMYAWTFIYVLGGIAPPSIQGMLTSKVAANEQGELQGLLTALTSLATILSPLLMTGLFYYFTSEEATIYFPGVSFFASAILVSLSLLIFIWYSWRKTTDGK